MSGGNGSLNLPICYRTVKYVHGQNALQASKNVNFVRGVASNGVAEIAFGPLQSEAPQPPQGQPAPQAPRQ